MAAVFTFVAQLGRPGATPVESCVRALLQSTRPKDAPAVILCALLMALGERAHIECTREMAFVRLELSLRQIAHLPPHAHLARLGTAQYVSLDARGWGIPLGFLPIEIRGALAQRRWGGVRERRLRAAS